MKYIECPITFDRNGKSLFLAGGISGCSNWQEEITNKLTGEDFVLLNPRRSAYDFEDSSLEKHQITWEHNHLELANAISFWFTPETLCPITLFELGKVAMSRKRLFVGIHSSYARKRDVELQLKLIRPEVKIVYSLEDLTLQIKNRINTNGLQ